MLSSALVGILVAGAPAPAASPAPSHPRNRLLLVTVTKGYRHDSIVDLARLLTDIGAESGAFTLDRARTDDELKAKTTPEALAGYSGIVFASTTGDLPVADRDALLRWIEAGHAVIGIHAAADTFHGYPPFLDMLGGEFEHHGPQAKVRVLVTGQGPSGDARPRSRLRRVRRDLPVQALRSRARAPAPRARRPSGDGRARARIRWPGRARRGRAVCSTPRSGIARTSSPRPGTAITCGAGSPGRSAAPRTAQRDETIRISAISFVRFSQRRGARAGRVTASPGRERVLLVGQGQRHLALEDERELLARLVVGMLAAAPPRTEDRDQGLELVALLHGSERLDVGVRPGAVEAVPLRRRARSGSPRPSPRRRRTRRG